MSSATLELYNALIDAGVDKEKAEQASKAVITRAEAQAFATKSNIAELRADMYKAMMFQTFAIVGTITGILALFF